MIREGSGRDSGVSDELELAEECWQSTDEPSFSLEKILEDMVEWEMRVQFSLHSQTSFVFLLSGKMQAVQRIS